MVRDRIKFSRRVIGCGERIFEQGLKARGEKKKQTKSIQLNPTDLNQTKVYV